MAVVLSRQTARRLREVLNREASTDAARPGGGRQVVYVKITNGLADGSGFYSCVPCDFITDDHVVGTDAAWTDYDAGLAISANFEALELDTRYLALRVGSTAAYTAVFVVVGGVAIGGEGLVVADDGGAMTVVDVDTILFDDASFSISSPAGGQALVTFTGSGGGGAGETWTFLGTLTYADFSTAASIFNVSVGTTTAKQLATRVAIYKTTNFTGGTISAYTVQVVFNSTAIIATVSVHSGAAGITLSDPSTRYAYDIPGGNDIYVQAVCSGDTLDHATAGSVDVWMVSATLP